MALDMEKHIRQERASLKWDVVFAVCCCIVAVVFEVYGLAGWSLPMVAAVAGSYLGMFMVRMRLIFWMELVASQDRSIKLLTRLAIVDMEKKDV